MPAQENNAADKGKIKAAQEAVKLVKSGMKIGLGTGSTAAFFIEALGKRLQEEHIEVLSIPTSVKSEQLAQEWNIPLIDPDDVTELDFDFDGADEVDTSKRLIKGGGGALLREKIIASMSREMIVLVDESKCKKQLGEKPLPIEVVPFGRYVTLKKLEGLKLIGTFRKNAEGFDYLTDNGNYIIDVDIKTHPSSPEEIHQMIKEIPGVVETGLFLQMAGRIYVGHANGKVEVLS